MPAEFLLQGTWEAWGQSHGLLSGYTCMTPGHTCMEPVTTAGTGRKVNGQDLNLYKVSNTITALEALGLGFPDAAEGFSKGLK